MGAFCGAGMVRYGSHLVCGEDTPLLWIGRLWRFGIASQLLDYGVCLFVC